MFEYAASYPREAEQSLRTWQSFYNRLLIRETTSNEIWIEGLGSDSLGRIEYKIRVSDELKAEAEQRITQIIESMISASAKEAARLLLDNPVFHLNTIPGQYEDDWWEIEVYQRYPPETHYKGSVPYSDLDRLKLIR